MKAIEQLRLEGENKKFAHAYLFIGGEDSDRSLILDYITKESGCYPEDVSVLRPENVTGKGGEIKIEAIRELLHTINLSPAGKARVVAVYNCEKLNQSSGNILLKSLEEPPSYLIFLLFARNDKVLATIKSRCRVLQLEGRANSEEASELREILGNGFFEATTRIEQVIKEEKVEQFIAEIEVSLHQRMLSTKSAVIAKALYEVEDYKKMLEFNANPKLMLECLYLKLESLNEK